jgi:hypothetical protein
MVIRLLASINSKVRSGLDPDIGMTVPPPQGRTPDDFTTKHESAKIPEVNHVQEP